MFKFLHAADIHLDSPLQGLDRYEGCPAEKIRGATRQALENLVNLAIGERVDFVVIAGDIYDGDWKNHDTGLAFVNRMAELRREEIPVFLIRGNHDAENLMTNSLRLPAGVTSFPVERPETHVLDHLGVAIHGQGFATRWVAEDLASGYPAADPGCFNLGLLHTCVDGGGHYAPCTVDSLRAKGYDYWALGHVHKGEILDRRDGPIAFPGNIQGRNIREGGPKGCLIVGVDADGRSSCDFRPLDVLRWETCRLDASAAAGVDDVVGRFERELPALLDGADGRLLAVRVEVVGESPAHDQLVARSHRLAEEVRSAALVLGSGQVWVEKVRVATRPPRTRRDGPADGPFEEVDALVARLRADDGRLGAFAARELSALQSKLGADRDALREAGGVDLSGVDWLRGVLDEARSVLLDRFEEARGGP